MRGIKGILQTLPAVVGLLLAFSPAVQGASLKPRIMIMIDEKNLGTYQAAEAENVAADYFMGQGFEVVDSELVKTNVNRDKALQAMLSSPQAAASLGLQFGAEVIIVGKAIAKGSAEHIKETSLRSYQAQVSLRAVRTDTAEIISYESGSAAKVHVDDIVGGSEAIRLATKPVVAAIVREISTAWSLPAGGEARKVQLVIGNVYQVWQVSAIKDVLRKKVPGVEEVIQRSYVSGTAIFDVRCSGDSTSLAEELTLAKPQYFSLRVMGITPGKLDMRLEEGGS